MRVLLVEDDENHIELIRRALEDDPEQFELEVVGSVTQARSAIRDASPDIIIADNRLPDGEGSELLPGSKDDVNIPTILMTSYGNERIAVEAIKNGALDYVVKSESSFLAMPKVITRSLREWRHILERRAAERKLRESEQRLELALESAGLGLWDQNFETGKVFRSRRWAEMLGFEPDEIASDLDAWKQLIHPDDRDRTAAADKAHEAGETEIYAVEHRMKTKSGQYRWILNWGKIVERDDRGLPIRATGTHLDITERKQNEEALRESEEKFRGIIDNIRIGICLVDKSMHIISLNRQMSQWFPDVAPAASATCCGILFGHKDEKTLATCPVARTLETGSVSENIIPVVIDGKARNFRIVASPIRNQSGEIVSAIMLADDITEKMKMEEELAKAEKLESIGVLAGGIAHDFNNILTAILGNVTLARIELAEGQDVNGLLREVEMAAARAKDLTQQLLTFSKGGAPIKKTASIREIIKDSATFALRGSNVKLAFEFPDNLNAVEVDEGQISQVISNLVINADQAMPQGGRITITCSNVTVSEASDLPLMPGDYVRVIIDDEGAGIPENYLNKIFDPFFTTKQAGSGLGLATTYSIIRSHFGHIEVISRVGIGTSFTVYLPASEHKFISKSERTRNSARGDGRILIVDDEEPVRKLALVVLKKLGYRAVAVNDGRDALTLYREAMNNGEPFDAVLLDITIPGGMGGKETIRELLKIDPRVTAIVSSGYANDPMMANYADYGFAGCVAKPYRADDLGNAIHGLLIGKDDRTGENPPKPAAKAHPRDGNN